MADEQRDTITENQWPTNIEFWQAATEADITRYLESGADPFALIEGTEHGDGAIHMAVRAANVEAYKALANAGGRSIEARNTEGDTSLHIATTTGSVPMMKAVCEDGAYLWSQRKAAGEDIYKVDHTNPAYHNDVWIVVKAGGSSREISRYDRVYTESEQGAGETALHIAVYNRDMDAVEYLLYIGAGERQSRNKDDETLLHWAGAQGDVKLACLLVKGGVDMCMRARHGKTVPRLAAEAGHPEAAVALIAHGPFQAKGVLLTSGQGGALPYAEAKRVILAIDPDNIHIDDMGEFIDDAVETGNTDAVKLLASHGANLERRDRYNRTPLLNATVNGNTEMAKVLIELGANTRAKFRAWSASYGAWSLDPLQYKDIGESVVYHRYEGQTAYDYAVDKGDLTMVETLAEGGARHSFVQGIKRKAQSFLGNAPRVEEANCGSRAETSVVEQALAGTGARVENDGPPRLNEDRVRWAESRIQEGKSSDKCHDR